MLNKKFKRMVSKKIKKVQENTEKLVNELKKTIQDINEKFNQKIFLKEKS
jgi:hypothetical protein